MQNDTGEAFGCPVAECRSPLAAVRVVVLARDRGPVVTDDDARTAQMVAQKIEAARVAGEAAAQEDPALIVADLGPTVVFVDAIDVGHCGPVHRPFDPIALGVIDEGGDSSRPLLDFGQPVLVAKGGVVNLIHWHTEAKFILDLPDRCAP